MPTDDNTTDSDTDNEDAETTTIGHEGEAVQLTGREVAQPPYGFVEEHRRYGIIARYGALIAKKMNFLMQSFRLYSRPLAYASEFGESFRPFVNPYFVNSLYGLSIFYVCADVGISCYHIRDKGRETQMYTALDQTVWHSMASLVFPAVTIHQIVHYSGKYATPKLSVRFPKYGRFSPIVFGLGSIPFIIHPLDHIADFVMNHTLRKFVYPGKIEIHSH